LNDFFVPLVLLDKPFPATAVSDQQSNDEKNGSGH
jgi:hypothetical protein